MKVLHLLDSLNRGGTEVLALDVCRNARAHGLDLVCAATGVRGTRTPAFSVTLAGPWMCAAVALLLSPVTSIV